MPRRPFEPKDILKIYQERGLRACNNFNTIDRDGRVAAYMGRCCPLTACFIGEPMVGYFSIMVRAEKRWPGFASDMFVLGFDRESSRLNERSAFGRSFYDGTPEYELGRETARLLYKHGVFAEPV